MLPLPVLLEPEPLLESPFLLAQPLLVLPLPQGPQPVLLVLLVPPELLPVLLLVKTDRDLLCRSYKRWHCLTLHR